MATPLIVELATRIAANTSKVSEYLAARGHPQPPFDVDTPPSPVPKDAADMELLRQAILEDTAELRSLMLGPRDFLMGSGSMVRCVPILSRLSSLTFWTSAKHSPASPGNHALRPGTGLARWRGNYLGQDG